MTSIQMVVPIVFWGGRVPSHEITQICKCGDSGTLATGCKTGELCLWTFHKDENKKDSIELHPQHLLIGSGDSEILSMCFVKNWTGDRNCVASLTAKGHINLWDSKDGTCVKHTTLPGKHTHIKAIERSRHSETLLICWGQYPDVFILDSSSLQILFMLRSSHTPNWLQQLCIVPNVEHKDAIIAATMEGDAKMWLLPANKVVVYQDLQPDVLYEERSVTLNLISALTMTSFSNGHHSSVLVVIEGAWQLYDATGGQMKLLAIHPCEKNVKYWQGGDFISMDTIAVWSKEGTIVIYKLSKRCVPGRHHGNSSEEGDGTTSGAEILAILQHQQPHPLNQVVASSYSYCVLHDVRYGQMVVQGDHTGRICMWKLSKLQQQTSSTPVSAHVTQSLANSWAHPAMPCSLTDPLGLPPYPDITCGLYLPTFGRLVCGRSDGTIASFSASQAATLLLLQRRKFTRGWPQHCIMAGHNGKVNHLLYPHAYRQVFDAKYILSGGVDFTVRMWDIYSGSLVHTFSAHSGAVTNIVVCPENMSPRLQTCVCSIADDHSVAILSTSEKKCLLLAATHASPIVGIHWRPVEDFLLVNCADGRLYVWQVEACVLDRCIEGSWAQAVLENTPDVSKKQLSDDSALRIHSLRVGGDTVTQVLVFDPQSVMRQLSHMHELEERIRAQEQSEAVAFRSYLSAKRHFNVTTGSTHLHSTPDMQQYQRSLYRTGINQGNEKAREKLSQGIASKRSDESDQLSLAERTKQLISIVRLLLSCLQAWNLDEELDKSCITQLGLVKPMRPVSYGLISRGSCLSLVLPGWGLHKVAEMSAVDNQISEKKLVQMNAVSKAHQLRWQLSRSLTTQHLLTVVSITNTLMNQSFGARMLAKEGGKRNLTSLSMSSDDSEDDDDQAPKVTDNVVRATWSQVAALHCVMLPEKLGNSFRPPHLPVLAGRYLDKCLEIREAAQALLQSELRRVGEEGRKKLVVEWASKLPPLAHSKRSRGDILLQSNVDVTDDPKRGAVATPQQQYTALIILGLIGAEFSKGETSRRHSDTESEMMDDSIARQTARSLQNVLLDTKPSLHTNLRRSAIDLIGRGFHLWERYLNVPLILIGLLDLAIQYPMNKSASASQSESSGVDSNAKLTSTLARKALITMVMAQPSSIISALAKEVSTHLAHSHTTHHPHSSFPLQIGVQLPPATPGIVTPSNKLLSEAKDDIFVLIESAIEKCMQKVTLQLIEVVDILLFCIDIDRLKKEKYLMESFPVFKKLPIVSYCTKSRCLAVGAQSGRVAIYDLKHFKCHMLNAHSYSITALNLSDDGKMLATYAYGDSTLSVWLLVSGLFGGILSSSPKCIQSWPAISGSLPAQTFNSTGGLYYTTSLEWSSNKSILLKLPGAVECRYSI